MKETIIRVQKRNTPFVIIDKRPINDPDLSWKAKGLLAYLLSKPNDWQVYLEELSTHASDGITSTKKAFKELKDKGYVKKIPVKDKDTGKIIRWETIVYEVPEIVPEIQVNKNPDGGKPTRWETHQVENQLLLNKDNTNKENTKYIYEIFDFWNSQKIVVHRELTKARQSKINAKLKHYTVEEIKETIKNYAEILKSEEHYFSHKWQLEHFLQRGFDQFRTENNPFAVFKKNNIKNSEKKEEPYPYQGQLDPEILKLYAKSGD